MPSSSSHHVEVAVPAPRGGASQPWPPPAVPLLADPGGGTAAGSPRPPPSQMAWAASTGGPAPRQIAAGCLPCAREGPCPRVGSGTRAKPGPPPRCGGTELRGHRSLLCCGARSGASTLAPEPCEILNQGCGQVTGSQWLNS